MELQAYKKGLRPIKSKVVNELYNKDYEIGASHEFDNKVVRAVMEYERLIRNYSKYFVLDSIKSRVNLLRSSDGYKTAILWRKVRCGTRHKPHNELSSIS